MAALVRSQEFFHVCMAGGLFSFMFLAFAQWAPSFFSRSHGMGTAEIGTWLAFIIGISQILAIYSGGVLADRLFRKDMRWPLWMSGSAILVSAPFFVMVYILDTPYPAMIILFLALFFVSLQGATIYAVVQNIASAQDRSVAAAILVLFFSLIGGLGPLAVGIASDLLVPSLGADSLRYALLVMTLVAVIWAAAHFFLATRTIRTDISA